MDVESRPARLNLTERFTRRRGGINETYLLRHRGMARLALGFALAATSLLNISAAHEAAAKPATRGAAPGLRGAPRGRGVARGRGSAGPGLRGTASQGAPTGALKRGAAPGAVRGATRGRGKPAPAVSPFSRVELGRVHIILKAVGDIFPFTLRCM